ncbi:MAG: NADPH:quinone reductase [Actinomycetota bacterium]|nr:NADPH:quinone reductase [Actinomycetota bacterium]MDQ1671012.1 NADPH:quinone reductase [Actinomycetota bacterium]
MRAIQVSRFGGPEVLELVDLPAPRPAGDLVRLHVEAAGVNYADTHQVADDYLAKQLLPFVPGAEAVGRTEDGRRVVSLLSNGGYAEQALAHRATTFDVPEDMDDATALALVLQGTTAWHLLRTSAHIAPGDSVVVVSAAGGVGSLAVQLAREMGASTVIATASTEEKRALACQLGADVALDVGATATAADVADAIRDANGGRPVDIVLEMTGGPVFDGSLAALAPFGRLVTYGMASRAAPTPVDAGQLLATSRAVIGFWLAQALRLPGGLRPAMDELFGLHGAGRLRAVHGGTYPLAHARRAHEDLRSRSTHGKLVLDTTV